MLVDDLVDLDVGQVVDGPGLQGGQHGLGQLVAVGAQRQVIDQAVLEGGIGLLDGLGGVDPVDPQDQRQDDPHQQ